MAKTNLLCWMLTSLSLPMKLGIWEQLKTAYRIAVPATIVREAWYFRSERGRSGINLQAEIDRGEIDCLEATADELISTFKDFDSSFSAGIDAGEKDAIALVNRGRYADYVFCTGDTVAMAAIGMLDLGNASIAFEDVVRGAKISEVRLRASLSNKTFHDHVKKGKTRRITGEGFKTSPLK
jgi:hypothetical protein